MFLSGRNALPSEACQFMAKLAVEEEESQCREFSVCIHVKWKSRTERHEEGVLEILKYMPAAGDLAVFPDYAENEWLYRLIAAERDQASGLTAEGPWD